MTSQWYHMRTINNHNTLCAFNSGIKDFMHGESPSILSWKMWDKNDELHAAIEICGDMPGARSQIVVNTINHIIKTYTSGTVIPATLIHASYTNLEREWSIGKYMSSDISDKPICDYNTKDMNANESRLFFLFGYLQISNLFDLYAKLLPSI